MSNRKRIKMLENWVKELNPKAFLHYADGRLGSLLAIATNNDDTSIHVWTQFMTPKEMEKALMLHFDNSFANIKNA